MKLIQLYCFFLLTHILSAQSHDTSIHYHINVSLDVGTYALNGQVAMTYTNLSEKALDFLSVQLHANAFKDQTSPYALQLHDWGNKRDNIGEAIRRGYYKKINFHIDSTDLKWSYNVGVKDVARVYLPQPLAPGATILITADIEVQMPSFTGNMGVKGDYWFLANFYPAFSVLHKGQWLEYAYPALGTQVLPFADFDVSISLPSSFTVAGNGALLDSIPQADGNNMYRFRAKGEKSFAVVASEQAIADHFVVKNVHGNDLHLHMLMDRDSSQWLLKYRDLTKQFILQYEQLLQRPYPKDELTVVWVNGMSHGGYPGLIVCGFDDKLCNVRERSNSLYPNFLTEELLTDDYTDPLLIASLETFLHRFVFMKNLVGVCDKFHDYLNTLGILHQNGYSQPLSLKASQFSDTGYEIAREILMYNAHIELYNLIGVEAFMKGVHALLNLPKDKLITKKEVQRIFEEVSGRDLSWLWVDMMERDMLPDYKINSIKPMGDSSFVLVVQNVGGLKNPVSISAISQDTVVDSRTFEGFGGEHQFEMKGTQETIFLVNFASLRSERNYMDNSQLTPLKLRQAAKKKGQKYLEIFDDDYWVPIKKVPIVAYNRYDGFLFGFNWNNVNYAGQPFQFSLMPLYTFRHNRIVGSSFLNYEALVYGDRVRSVEGGLEMRSFDKSVFQNDAMRFVKVNPYLAINFINKRLPKNVNRRLTLSEYWISEENPNFANDGTGSYLGAETNHQWVHRLEYMVEKQVYFNPYRYKASLQHQTYSYIGQRRGYLRLDAEYLGAFYYDQDKEIKVKARGGVFLYNTERYSSTYNNLSARASLSLWGRGREDQLYQYVHGGRSEQYGFWSQQVTDNGVFRNNIPDAYPYGQSNSYMLGVSVTAHIPFLPGWFPLKIYGDVGMTPEYEYIDINNYKLQGHRLEYIAGVCVEINDVVGLYFPLLQSENIGNVFKEQGYSSSIGFKVSLEKLELIRSQKLIMNN